MNRTFFHALCVAADIFAAAILWTNKGFDITISSMCGLELRKYNLKIPGCSKRLVYLGKALNWIQRGHCESAIQADILRCQNALYALGAWVVK